MVWNGIVWGGLALTASAMAYCVAAWVAVRTQNLPSGRAPPELPTPERMPAATILKPLCGAEPDTYECLRSFCDQDYPHFQVVFGVADLNDPALQFMVLPLRDVLSLALWSWSFATRRVHWRNEHYHVNRDGSVLPVLRL